MAGLIAILVAEIDIGPLRGLQIIKSLAAIVAYPIRSRYISRDSGDQRQRADTSPAARLTLNVSNAAYPR